MHLWSLAGNTQKLDGGSMFGNAPRTMWSRWIEPDAHNRIPLACRCLLARDLDGRNVLFETGIGAFFEPRLRERYGVVEARHVLLDSLHALNLDDADIDVVVLSHLHFDHVGGLLAPWTEGQPLRLLFPNARILVGETHWQRARHPHPRDRASFVSGLDALLEASGRLELVRGAHSRTLGEAVHFEYSEGHTPGLMLAEIVGPGGRDGHVFCADLIPGRAWVHVPITMGYDRYPERLIDEKRAFLADKLERGVQLFFTHDAQCASARLGQDERGRYHAIEERAELAGVEL